MLSPSAINPFTLPSLPLADRRQLPRCSGIYFAIDSQGQIQYIGQTRLTLKERWIQHHCYRRLEAMGGIRIAYLHLDDLTILNQIEAALIHCFKPPLNGKPGKKTCTPVSSKGLKVRKTTDVDAPGLGAKIKAAREADNRSLLSICKEVELTPMYWYKIEAEEVKALPVETLRRIEQILGVSFGVEL